MKKTLLTGLATGLLVFGITGVASALEFNQNVTSNYINAGGVTNGSFTVDRANGIELGLRGKLRFDANGLPQNTFNSNGDGTYSFATGGPGFGNKAVWSWEWSVNSDWNATDNQGGLLNAYTYIMGYDSDASQGTSFTIFDPIMGSFIDNAYGNNSTAQSAGVVATAGTYTTLRSQNNLAQNSWQPSWFLTPFDPNVDGTYDFYLAAFGANGAELARTEIQVIVGQGGAPVPEPATMLLFGAGIAGLAAVGRRKRS